MVHAFLPTAFVRLDATVSIGPSLCTVSEWSVSVAGTEC